MLKLGGWWRWLSVVVAVLRRPCCSVLLWTIYIVVRSLSYHLIENIYIYKRTHHWEGLETRCTHLPSTSGPVFSIRIHCPFNPPPQSETRWVELAVDLRCQRLCMIRYKLLLTGRSCVGSLVKRKYRLGLSLWGVQGGSDVTKMSQWESRLTSTQLVHRPTATHIQNGFLNNSGLRIV